MANIVYVDDFLESELRVNTLYELKISLALEITEIAFRSVITQLNVKFITPRVIFSGLWTAQELTLYYSADGQLPAVSQKEIVFALMTAFDDYSPSIKYEESEGEIPGAAPLVTPKAEEPRPLLSPEWVPEFFEDVKEEVKEVAKEVVDEIEKVTGWPRELIPYILGAGAVTVILAILYIKIKPVLVIKTKES